MAASIVCAVTRNTPKAVLRVASGLAEQLACRLQLVHVYEKTTLPGRSRDERHGAGRELLAELLCEVPASVDAGVRLQEGAPTEAILDACADAEACLLVVGSPKRRSFNRRSRLHRLLALGSDCALIIVPREADPLGRQEVVCGLDWSPRSRQALQLAIVLAERLDRRLIVVHAPGRESSALDRALEGSSGDGVVTIEAEPSAEVLKHVALTYNAGLVVAGDEESNSAGMFARTSPASWLVRRGDRPVALLPRDTSRSKRGALNPHFVEALADAA